VISRQFTDLQDAQPTLLGKGWDFDAYRVGDVAFRFPRRTEVVSRLVNEIRLVEHLRTNVDFNTQIPVYNRFGAGSELFPYPFAGYPFIDGQNAAGAKLSQSALHTLSEQIGVWLGKLHNTERSRLRGIGVKVDNQGVEQRLERLLGQADLARSELPSDAADEWEPFLNGDIDLPDPHSGTSVLLHNDLVAEHLLVEPQTGKLVGVIDLTDAALGDPVQDFVGLRVAFGRPFVRRALESYGRSIDRGFWERLECRADLLRLTQFVEAARRGVDRKKYEERLIGVPGAPTYTSTESSKIYADR
jgi:aminoglycoside phosphotransferase (APT) family kinase protein